MNHYVYIIKSEKGRHYLGCTSNVQDRLIKHNSRHKEFTGTTETWELLTYVEVETKIEALKLERYLKSLKNYRKAINHIEKLNSSVG